MSLLPSLSAWRWRWGCIARPRDKIISLSDGPPPRRAHSRSPVKCAFGGGVRAGGSRVP